LGALGKVQHVIELGAYHLGVHNGLDDPFYVQCYNAKLWTVSDMEHKQVLKTTDALTPQTTLPIKDLAMFQFDSSKMSEGLLLLKPDGGILIACDSLLNGGKIALLFSEKAAVSIQRAGFIPAANVGSQWYKVCEQQSVECERILLMPFGIYCLPIVLLF